MGNARLDITKLAGIRQRTFAQRVADSAACATARVVFQVGGEEVVVERNLRDLSLREFNVGTSPPSQDEGQCQSEMIRLANVSTFSDWILLLRYIVFYFEDRRSLVWDPSAQRQLLRILFLRPDESRNWLDREREILEMDTRVRNMRAVATGEERSLTYDQSLATGEPAIREELRELELHQKAATESLDEITSDFSAIEARHEGARLRFHTLEQERESHYRELERAQLLAVNARLPKHSDSARYILTRLLTEAECLVCGNNVPSVMESMESHIRENRCVICRSDLTSVGRQIPTDLVDERVRRREIDLQTKDYELEAARNELREAEDERTQAATRIYELQSAIAERRNRTEVLLRLLPPEEGQLHKRQREVASLRARIEIIQRDLEEKRTSFPAILATANEAVEDQASEVQNSFGEYAHEFLLEDCRLIWSPRPARLGQTGRRFNFPAFELELAGSNFSGTVRRSGPEEVSESQREFIDISFRMALVRVATRGRVTSLVMDAPESSLDAVFVQRAARIMGTFGRPEEGNRLVVTSNLIEGDLIPSLLRRAADRGDRSTRVVNLLAMATPTAALKELRDEYDAAMENLLRQADESEWDPKLRRT